MERIVEISKFRFAPGTTGNQGPQQTTNALGKSERPGSGFAGSTGHRSCKFQTGSSPKNFQNRARLIRQRKLQKKTGAPGTNQGLLQSACNIDEPPGNVKLPSPQYTVRTCSAKLGIVNKSHHVLMRQAPGFSSELNCSMRSRR